MDLNGNDVKTKPLISSLKTQKEEGDESKRLFSPFKTKRRVQWNDTNGGNKLAEVLEFMPSDVSDSEDDDDSDSDSCFCRIM